MNSKLNYECGECSDLHDDEDSARECCEPAVFEVYSCGHCGMAYGANKDIADECCDDVDPNAAPIMNQADLEAAGQLRLTL